MKMVWRAALGSTIVFCLAAATSVAATNVSSPDRQACVDGRLRVGIDVGHSKHRPGTDSATGRREYAFNIRFARELVAKSHRDGQSSIALDLFIHNPDGNDMELAARPFNAERMGAEIFISIHHDSAQRSHLAWVVVGGRRFRQSPTIKGFSLFVSRRNPRFRASGQLAMLIGRSFRLVRLVPSQHHAEDIRGERREELDREAGIYAAPFTVLTTARIPAVLVEVGVIANAEEERSLDSPEYRAITQLALLNALEAFCSTTPK